MTRIEAVRGEVVQFQWHFATFGLTATNVRSTHIHVEVHKDDNLVVRLNNLDGGVTVDIRKNRIKASVKTMDFDTGLYNIWVQVLRGDGSIVRQPTHFLSVIKG